MANITHKASTPDKPRKSQKSISPYTVAILASRIMLEKLSKQILANQAKVKDKTDLEALHDFRITVRKIRSLLSQLDGVLPEPGLSEYRSGFAELMDKTSLLRDIEVCNVMLSTIDSEVSFVQQEHILPFVKYMRTKERYARNGLMRYLNSAAHENFINGWLKYLDELRNVDKKMERSDSPIRLVASEAISLRYLKTVKQARKTAGRSSIEEIHMMRKSAKKLRYLIESFSVLYSNHAVKKMLNELKKFQDTLGKMQDVEVQSKLILGVVAEMGDKLDIHNKHAIEKIIGKKEKRKGKMQNKALKLIEKFPQSSRKKMDTLITV